MNTPIKATKIYLDMDGVIADFTKRYKELYHMEPREAEKHKQFDIFFRQFIATSQFETLDLMPDAMVGINYLRRLPIPTEILSSTAREEFHADIQGQKRVWLKMHDIKFKQNFVPGKRNKYKFAEPTHIIIDDTESVIRDWNNAGGIGILHTDWTNTLAILKKYV